MLVLEGLTHVHANGARALEDASLTIPADMVGLLGPDGAGQATLMRCIATLQTRRRAPDPFCIARCAVQTRFGGKDAVLKANRLNRAP